MSGRLEEAKDKLERLLVEADKDTMKENIPKTARAKCLDAWSTASSICLRILKNITQQSLTITKAMIKLLKAIMRNNELSVIHNTHWLSCR